MNLGTTGDHLLVAIISLTFVWGCDQSSGGANPAAEVTTPSAPVADSPQTPATEGETAELVLAGGCFWCMEVAFEQLRGVQDVVSGYAGGTAESADYQTVSAGLSRHAEAIRITYDPAVISSASLLDVFFHAAHDPTQINRQYPDVGRQYRSAVFYADEAEKQAAAAMIQRLNRSGEFDKPIATTLERLKGFYVAEDYHQDYVQRHPHDRYVVAHSLPKAAKVRELYPDLLREN